MRRPGEFDEAELELAGRGKPPVNPVVVALSCVGGGGLGTVVHTVLVNRWLPSETWAVGLIPLFGIACTVKLIQGLLYVAAGSAIGVATGLAGSLLHRRPLLVIGAIAVGIVMSIVTTSWAASFDWKCASPPASL